jgi:hypothetical protein
MLSVSSSRLCRIDFAAAFSQSTYPAANRDCAKKMLMGLLRNRRVITCAPRPRKPSYTQSNADSWKSAGVLRRSPKLSIADLPKQLNHSQNPLRFPLPPIYNPKFKSRVAGKQ